MPLFASSLPSKDFSIGADPYPIKHLAQQTPCECGCLHIWHLDLKLILSLYNAVHDRQVIPSQEMKQLVWNACYSPIAVKKFF